MKSVKEEIRDTSDQVGEEVGRLTMGLPFENNSWDKIDNQVDNQVRRMIKAQMLD